MVSTRNHLAYSAFQSHLWPNTAWQQHLVHILFLNKSVTCLLLAAWQRVLHDIFLVLETRRERALEQDNPSSASEHVAHLILAAWLRRTWVFPPYFWREVYRTDYSCILAMLYIECVHSSFAEKVYESLSSCNLTKKCIIHPMLCRGKAAILRRSSRSIHFAAWWKNTYDIFSFKSWQRSTSTISSLNHFGVEQTFLVFSFFLWGVHSLGSCGPGV